MDRPDTNRTVIVGMSGGVDSSVAALRLLEAGYRVEGLFMDNWDDGEDDTYCTAAEDFQDARQVCEMLEIPLHKADFADEYRERVFAHFLAEYAAGRTPNPDVLCNSEIKFKAFLDHALRLGADHIATGHYARREGTGADVSLLRARDLNKDQTYFLHAIAPQALSHTLFPLGELEKPEVRRIAHEAGFANHGKRDSTGICFIGERRFAEFLARFLPAQPGPIQTLDGIEIGRHQGLMYYTLGQRQGLGIGGVAGTPEEPWYVVGKDLAANILYAAQGHDHPALFSSSLSAGPLHWFAGTPPARRFTCTAKVRYRQTDVPCTVTIDAQDHATVRFDDPQRAVTPGQYVVFYDADVCLGGATILATQPCSPACQPLRARQA